MENQEETQEKSVVFETGLAFLALHAQQSQVLCWTIWRLQGLQMQALYRQERFAVYTSRL